MSEGSFYWSDIYGGAEVCIMDRKGHLSLTAKAQYSQAQLQQEKMNANVWSKPEIIIIIIINPDVLVYIPEK